MKRREIDPNEYAPTLTKMIDVLVTEPNAVRQVTNIELLMAWQASRMAGHADGDFVIDSMAKHAKQFLGGFLSTRKQYNPEK